jgi:hypothetical protein
MKAATLVLLFLLPLQDAAPPKLELRIASDGWGSGAEPDIEEVLRSAAGTLLPRFPGLKLPVLEISRSAKDPITLYERGPKGEIRVRLDVENRQWARFAFQFSHEICHVFCGIEEYPNPNMWFEESICEVSSLFALGRMAEQWKVRAPYKNWTGYAKELQKYRDERISTRTEKIPEGTTLPAWFQAQESKLRADAHLRQVNLEIAVALLPLFEEAPEHWECVRFLNAVQGDATRSFSKYLSDWSRSSPEKHREFIRKIGGRLGVEVGP